MPIVGTGQFRNTAFGQRRRSDFWSEKSAPSLAQMPFLWLEVTDEPGPNSLRAYIERNAIALLSNYRKPQSDSPSCQWLGRSVQPETGEGFWSVEFQSR